MTTDDASGKNVAGMVECAGVTLNYRLQGTGTRKLICIHGVGSTLEAWDGVTAALGGDFRILTFDLRGHGRSSLLKKRYEIEDFVSDALALADHVGFDHFDLAGFSLGGVIAQSLALMAPERVNRLVLLSTVAGRTPEESERVLARMRALQAGDRGAHHDASLSRWLTEGFQERYPDVVTKLRQRNAANDPECYASAYRVLAETDLGELLDRIRVPTLIATGEEDQGSNPRMAEYMHRRIAGSRMTILPGLRHSILTEAPTQVAGMMRRFLVGDDAATKEER